MFKPEMTVKNGISWVIILVITAIIQPWRISVSQDDANYAAQTIQFASGVFKFHPDATAFLLPQTLIGASAVYFFNFFNPIRVLNFSTWIIFIGITLWVKREFKLKCSLWLSFFSVPFWFQYGASFLYDIWAIALLTVLLSLNRRRSNFHWALLAMSWVSGLLVLQLQALAVFPFFFGIKKWVKKQYRQAIAQWVGLLLGIVVYLFLEKSLSQKAVMYWMADHHKSLLEVIFNVIQLCCGLGFFLLPWIRGGASWTRKRVIVTAGVHFTIWVCLWVLTVQVQAAGVFFSDYLPRGIAAFFASVGIWGWSGASDLFTTRKWSDLWPGVLGILAVFGLYSFRGVADIRYAMIAVPLVLSWIQVGRLQENRMGSSPLIAGLAVLVSLFLNLYQLDTNEARWKLAAELESRGINPKEISAGYGRDHFTLEWECITRQMERLGQPPVNSSKFLNEIYAYVPRTYEKGWNPRFLIKPARIFGQSLNLKMNRKLGQDLDPIQLIPYRSFGFRHALGLYEIKDAQFAECFSGV